MEPIEFEGKTVKYTKNVYKCPYCRKDPRFPAQKWRTEKGFRQHMEKCTGKPSAIAAQKINLDKKRDQYEEVMSAALASLKYKVGDKISYVREIIIKPTHEWRGERQVRVRYEAVKKFQAEETVITSITALDGEPFNVEYFTKNLILFNRTIRTWDLCDSFEAAQNRAKREQESYDAHVKFSQDVR